MLMQRVITALALIPPVVAAIWYLPTQAVAALLATVFLIGAWEWSGLMRLQGSAPRLAYAGTVALLFAVLFFLRDIPGLQQATLWLATAWWLLALLWVIRYPAGLRVSDDRMALKAITGLLLLAPAFFALVIMHARVQGPQWILFLLVLIWAADTGAYFAGRGFGRHKLAERVSPGKTWEGAAGGMILSSLVAVAAGVWLFHLDLRRLLPFMMLCAVVIVFSVVGDLTESMFKRHAGAKDSGTLFPGHGGVLDRLDSLFAAAPVFLAGMLLLGI